MTAKCDRCFYGVPVYVGDESVMMEACTYVLHTGRKRPCPAGPGCTVYRPTYPQERGERRRI